MKSTADTRPDANSPVLVDVAALLRSAFERQRTGPKHRRLYRGLQQAIHLGTLAAGTRLPPSRVLAEWLVLGRNTVVHVYAQLALEGLVLAGVGRGTFVASALPRLQASAEAGAGALATRRALLSRRGVALVDRAGAAALQWGAFTPGVPEVRLFPAAVWSRLQSRLWRSVTPPQLSYATGGGDHGLRSAVAEHLRTTRDVNCTPDQVIITSGTQQSLHLVAQLLTDPGDRLWMEDPGYWGARSVFSAYGLQLVPVPLDAEGLAPGPQHLREPPRAMFVSPSHQYPTGVLMSHGRRRQLLDYAALRGVWVIEDDYDSAYRYGARPLPALQSLDHQGRVVYLGTFSKTLFPALRLAYLVAPAGLAAGFAQALNELYREGQTPQQAVLARFMSEGHYASHLRRMRTVYRGRRDALMAAIQQHFGQQLPVLGGQAGMHLVLGLPASADDAAIAHAVAQAGITCRPLSMYQLGRPASARGLLLGYGAVDEDEIARNFARLAEVLQRRL